MIKIKSKFKHKVFKRKKKNKSFFKSKLKFIYITIFILLFLIIIIQTINKNISFLFFKNNIIKQNEIISVKKYERFENMKHKYIIDSIINPYLEQITIFNYIYNKNHKQLKKNKNNIHICVGLTNEYLYPVLVAIKSVLVNCNKEKTFITCHVLCSSDFSEDSLLKLSSLMTQHSYNLEMIFYNMGNNFLNHYTQRFTQASYYRTLSPILFDTDRVIYLDADTLTLKDLSEMYQLEFNDNYVLGSLDYIVDGIDNMGIKSEKFINSGVILLNLEKIRKDKKIYDIINIVNDSKNNVQDQALINYVFYPKIGIMPSKYNIFNFNDELDIKIYYNLMRTKLNITELKEAFKDPTTIHHVLCWPKMWSIHHRYVDGFSAAKERNNYSCEKYYNLWHSYAKKTSYYNEIITFASKSK